MQEHRHMINGKNLGDYWWQFPAIEFLLTNIMNLMTLDLVSHTQREYLVHVHTTLNSMGVICRNGNSWEHRVSCNHVSFARCWWSDWCLNTDSIRIPMKYAGISTLIAQMLNAANSNSVSFIHSFCHWIEKFTCKMWIQTTKLRQKERQENEIVPMKIISIDVISLCDLLAFFHCNSNIYSVSEQTRKKWKEK